jgi:hypothetical protein
VTFLPILGEITKQDHKNYFRDFQEDFSTNKYKAFEHSFMHNFCRSRDLSANLLKIQFSNYAN